MEYLGVTHIALSVPSVPDAEEYYCSLLGLAVAFRDVEVEGEWYSLRPGTDWRAADGWTRAMSALGNGALVLALEEGDRGMTGPVDHIGLRLTLEDLTALRIRAFEHEVTVEENRADLLVFRDRYGVCWEAGLTAYDQLAVMATGNRTGRWWPA